MNPQVIPLDALLPMVYEVAAHKPPDDYFKLTIERVRQLDGTELWAIRQGNNVYSKRAKGMVYEVMPSNRTNAVLKDTRFDTLELAYATAVSLIGVKP